MNASTSSTTYRRVELRPLAAVGSNAGWVAILWPRGPRRPGVGSSRAGPSTQEDPIGLAGGMNLYGYAGGDPVNNSDPFGLCPEKLRDARGNCPGGITVKEWQSVEAELQNMTNEAAARTSGLLFGGRIHGANLAPDVAGRVSSRTPGDIDINRTAGKHGSIFESSLIGPTLVHEGKHVDQLKGKAAGREAYDYAKAHEKKLEEEAKAYERANYKKP